MRVEYSAEARKDLKALDKATAARIIKKVSVYASDSDPRKHAKSLTGSFRGFYRFCVGGYRVVFSISEDGTVSIIVVILIAHRKDVYR
jgi:mRNA interferase RelE/StbE